MNSAISEFTSEDQSEIRTAVDVLQSIIICDVNPVLAYGVQHVLQDDAFLARYSIKVIEPTDLNEIKALAPEILIIDPWQTVDAWSAVVDAFRDISKVTSLICYCPEISPAEARAVGAVGFRAIMPKTIGGKELVRIVCSVAFGGIYLHDTYIEKISSPVGQRMAPAAIPAGLTERELEVLRHVALGSSLKEIATILNISTKTVDTYRSRANQKLNLRTRSDIVRFAIQSGWMN